MLQALSANVKVQAVSKFPYAVVVVESRAETEKCPLPLVEVAVPDLCGTGSFCMFSSRQGSSLVLHTCALCVAVTEIRAIPCYLLFLVIFSPGYLFDSKLCGAINVVEERDAIQRELDKPERWACENLVKFNKAK